MGFGPDDVESLCRELNVRGILQVHCLTMLPFAQTQGCFAPYSSYMARAFLYGHQSRQ